MERSAYGLSEVKFSGGDGKAMAFSGYGAVFGNVDSYGDVIEKGAFRQTLADAKRSGAWPAMLAQHGGWGLTSQDMMPIGIWTSMSEDDTGLFVEGQLADTERGREAYALLKMDRPALNGLSIGYIAKSWEEGSRPDEPRRKLKKVDLLEVSIVTFPANPKARVGAIKSADGITTIRDLEDLLRDAGLSRSEALAVASRFQAKADRRESGQAQADFVAAAERLVKSLKTGG